ncbi:hypothetical protein EGC86_10950 [Shewanella frigidimarina]|nr:hypothetical protein EGC86_10950 [Shewanella frigidimarina]
MLKIKFKLILMENITHLLPDSVNQVEQIHYRMKEFIVTKQKPLQADKIRITALISTTHDHYLAFKYGNSLTRLPTIILNTVMEVHYIR